MENIVYFIYNIGVSIAVLLTTLYFMICNLARKPLITCAKIEFEKLTDKRVIWVQAKSAGETMVAARFIQEIKKEWPDYQIVFTTTTIESIEIAKQKFADLAVISYLPWKLPVLIKRFIRRLHPVLFIMVERILWPNAIRYSKEVGAMIVLINGWINDYSYHNYLRCSWFLKLLLQQIDLFAMQTEEDAKRIVNTGAAPARVTVTGNIKFDHDYPVFSQEQHESFRRQYDFERERPIFTAASTHRGEEEIVIQAYLDLIKTTPYYLILAPRYPERAKEIELLLQQYKLSYVKRSSGESGRNCLVLLLDTLGELGLAYAVADLVLVGGSLVKLKGIAGHNILEAAAQEKPVFYGPYMNNFWESKRLLEEVDAGFTVKNPVELTQTIKRLTADRSLYQHRALNAKKVVLAGKGATQKTVGLLGDLIRSNS